MTLIIIITIVVLLALYVISVNNKYVRLKNQSEEAGSALDAHLKQRYDWSPIWWRRSRATHLTSRRR